MGLPHRIIISSTVLVLVLVAACGSKKDVEFAKSSVYDTDFANVYNAALVATRDLYPQLNDNPGPGKISTAWHQVSYGNNQDDSLGNQRTVATGGGMQGGPGGAGRSSGMPTRLSYKRYFIRFDVSVIGGRPWRVKVVGHASEWDPGAAMPTEMRGANRPPWLDGRIDGLNVAIYKRIKQFAIPVKEEVEGPRDEGMVKTDPTTFAGVPAGAGKTLAYLKDALAKRDYVAMRPLLADDIIWSLGGGTGADVAVVTWQADPGILESMQAAITAGCAPSTDGNQVTCPGGPPQIGIYQVVLEDRGGWKLTSFVKAE